MGIIIAKVFHKDKDPAAPEFLEPTPAQLEIIKETWEIPNAHLTDTGELILFRFLDKYPEHQDKFDAFRNVPLLSLKVVFSPFLMYSLTLRLSFQGTPGFRTHATRMLTMFKSAIASEDILDTLTKNFLLMGKTHAKRNTPKISYYELRGVILEVLTEACNLNEEQQEAWLVFLNYTIYVIFSKYDEDMQRKQRH